jgi:S-methylmethionine-dependent homocysteine/selenocysteine methylase
MRTARAEIYKAREQSFKELQERRAADTAAARERAGELAREAKASLAADVEVAKVALAANVGSLAGQIADSLLRQSAA